MDKHEIRRQRALKAFLKERGFEIEYKESWNHAAGFDGVLHKLTGQGDYVGGVVERSNREVLLEKLPKLLGETSSGYGYEACTLLDPMEFMEAWHWPNHDLHLEARELGEILDACSDYPLVDDEHHSALELQLIDEALPEAVEEIWEEALAGWDEDLVPFPAELKEKIEAALTGRGGAHCPEIETGCIVHFVELARVKAQDIAQEHMVKWEKGIREGLADAHEIPGSSSYTGWDVQSASEMLEEIRSACAGAAHPFEAIDAIKRIARILNHPQEV